MSVIPYTVEQAALVLRRSEADVLDLIHSGELAAHYSSRDRLLVRHEDLVAFVSRTRKPTRKVKSTFYLRPNQAKAIRDEALRRMRARGLAKPDAGEVVREIIDLWLASPTRPTHPGVRKASRRRP